MDVGDAAAGQGQGQVADAGMADADGVGPLGADGLGRFIIDGRAVNDQAEIFAGALLVALLSLLTEGGLALVQSAVTPRGLREADVPTGAEAAAIAVVAEPPEGRGSP